MRYFTLILVALTTTYASAQIVLFNNTYTQPLGGTSAAVIERQDGNYLIAGSTQDPILEEESIYLLLIDPVGNLIWDKVIEKADSYESPISLIETSDNNYLISGTIWPNNFPYLLLFDGEGTPIWDKTYTTAGPGYGGFSVGETEVGDFFFVQHDDSINSSSETFLNTTLYNVSSTGEINWSKAYASANCFSVVNTMDGGYAMTGMVSDSTYSPLFMSDIILIKTNSVGEPLWTQKYKYDRVATAYSLLQTPDGGFLIAGFHDDLSLENRYQGSYLIRTDAAGDTLWTKSYGDLGTPFHIAACEYSSGYIMSSSREVWIGPFTGPDSLFMNITKLDTNGNIEWSREFDGSMSIGNNVTQTADGGFLLTGTSFLSPLPGNIVLIKLDSNGDYVLSTKLLDGDKSANISVYPNPASEFITFKLNENDKQVKEISIFNIEGQKVKEIHNPVTNPVELEINDFSNGIYFYEITSSAKERYSGKFLVNK